MAHRHRSLQVQLAAITVLAFVGLVLAALDSGIFFRTLMIPDRRQFDPAQVHLASFRQDAVPSLEGGGGLAQFGTD